MICLVYDGCCDRYAVLPHRLLCVHMFKPNTLSTCHKSGRMLVKGETTSNRGKKVQPFRSKNQMIVN